MPGSPARRHRDRRARPCRSRSAVSAIEPHRVRRDREPTPSLPPESLLDLRVDADHLAVDVEERPAGVAVVDRRVGLDRVVDREVVRRFICRWSALTMPLVTVSSSPNGLPIATTVSPTARCPSLRAGAGAGRRRRVDLDHREVGRGIGSDDGGLVGRAVPELNRDRLAPSTTWSFVTMWPLVS